LCLMSESALNVHERALLRRERSSTQPKASLMVVRVCVYYWPRVICPQWCTVSICQKPGMFRSLTT
jgi:hypothetical protein